MPQIHLLNSTPHHFEHVKTHSEYEHVKINSESSMSLCILQKLGLGIESQYLFGTDRTLVLNYQILNAIKCLVRFVL